MCSLETKVKSKINSITKQVNLDRAHKLGSKLKLEQNEFVSSDSKLRTVLFSLINEYHDVFTSDQCKVGNTSWVKFKIELNRNAQPVKQRVRCISIEEKSRPLAAFTTVFGLYQFYHLPFGLKMPGHPFADW